MTETDRADGNILAGLRGLATSIAMNGTAHGLVTVVGAVAAAAAWAFVPGLWDTYIKAVEARLPATSGVAILVTFLAVVATGVPVWIQLHRAWVMQRLADQQTNEYAELVVLLRGYLTPCIENLPKVVSGGVAGQAALADVKRAVLNAAQAICGPRSEQAVVRAVLFEVEGQTLVPKDWTGGATNSTRRFANRTNGNNPAGTTAWRTAQTGQPVLYRDLRKEAPNGYERGPNSAYETFITCGVLAPTGQVCAMLNVDAPRADMLTDVDAMVVGVCARVLGAAYALSQPRGTV